MASEPLAAPSLVPPMNRYAGQIVGFAAPLMQVRYPAGVYVSLAGFPTWIRYARAIVELPPTAPTETMCRIRVTDVAAANELMARTGDPLWQPKQEGVPVTPDGWQWAHLAKTRRIALLPGELATAFRHWGGMATLRAEPDEVGLRTGGGGAVEFVPAEQAAAEDDLVKLEQEIGHPLPAAYREFVTRTNGGRPAVPAVHPSFGFVVDQSLFTVTGKDWLRSLRYVRRWVTDRFTDDFLPLGRVRGGAAAGELRRVRPRPAAAHRLAAGTRTRAQVPGDRTGQPQVRTGIHPAERAQRDRVARHPPGAGPAAPVLRPAQTLAQRRHRPRRQPRYGHRVPGPARAVRRGARAARGAGVSDVTAAGSVRGAGGRARRGGRLPLRRGGGPDHRRGSPGGLRNPRDGRRRGRAGTDPRVPRRRRGDPGGERLRRRPVRPDQGRGGADAHPYRRDVGVVGRGRLLPGHVRPGVGAGLLPLHHRTRLHLPDARPFPPDGRRPRSRGTPVHRRGAVRTLEAGPPLGGFLRPADDLAGDLLGALLLREVADVVQGAVFVPGGDVPT